MPTWRCPHCQTPQPESSRCWVCRRSSTSCSTCRHFRGSICGQLGYCGLDRRRVPLRGDEIRGCWEGAPLPLVVMPRPASSARNGINRLEFVPVASPDIPDPAGATPPSTSRPIPKAAAAQPPEGPRASLWDD